ncbi:NUDIX hydrolase [Roseibium sp. CAU 1637]|uniref:NUDIX hydrolase n=1 Tax=Roseibium limicola TaxID=2816037 RepID=A0A939ENL1_9HYPH|nr:NUDIX hydrolase [Roseibium limicola]
MVDAWWQNVRRSLLKDLPTLKKKGRQLKRVFKSLFTIPDRLQIGALCYRWMDDELQVLLLTTRDTRRWILPKGWPMMKKKGHRTALIEAFEEAGVIGRVTDKQPFDSFQSHKGFGGGLKVDTSVLVYVIEAVEMTENFPEAGEREIRWLSVGEALDLIEEDAAKPILSRFSEEMQAQRASA